MARREHSTFVEKVIIYQFDRLIHDLSSCTNIKYLHFHSCYTINDKIVARIINRLEHVKLFTFTNCKSMSDPFWGFRSGGITGEFLERLVLERKVFVMNLE